MLDPSLFALARRMLQVRLWQAALRAGKPYAAVLNTSLTRPEDRLLIAMLKQHQVPVALVLPRPVNPDRPAEKLLELDCVHPDTLPDLFVARDYQSRDALIDQGIDADRIAVGLPMPSTDGNPSGAAPEERVRVLVLLTVLENANTLLCRMIADALHDARDLDVIVRCHPGLPLGEPACEALDRLQCGWRTQPGAAIGEQATEGTLAVTATSTSAIEAARHGAAIVWAPFLSEIALFQRRFMQQLGRIAETEAELIDMLRSLTGDKCNRVQLAAECRQSAQARFSAEKSITDVVLEWLEVAGNRRQESDDGSADIAVASRKHNHSTFP